MASPAHWPSRATPRREEEAGVPLRVLRLRAHHIATFKPGGESEGADEDADGAGGRASSGEPFALDAGATLQQLLAAVTSAWARSGAAPLSSPLREAYTVAGERITRVSALQDGDDVVFATYADLRPVLCDDLAMVRLAAAPGNQCDGGGGGGGTRQPNQCVFSSFAEACGLPPSATRRMRRSSSSA